MDITSPINLWKNYDVLALPLNKSALSQKTENDYTVKEFYFDGYTTVPATGIMGELEYVNIGVGYTLPFQLATAPWIDGHKLCDAMREAKVPGMEWRPVFYKPFYSQFKGEAVSGVQPYFADPDKAVISLTQFYLMEQLARLYPVHKPFASASQTRLAMFDKVCGSKKIRQAFSKNYRVADIYDLWMGGCDAFREKTRKYRLYE